MKTPEYKAKKAVINIHTVDGQNFGVHVSPRLDYWGVSDQEYVVEAREIANTLVQSRYRRHTFHCSRALRDFTDFTSSGYPKIQTWRVELTSSAILMT